MTDRSHLLESIYSGASDAVVVVFFYFCATFGGISLGAWSAGWFFYGPEPCVFEFLSSYLGLQKLVGLLCFVGLCLTTLFYYKVNVFRWESLNLLALLWLLYVYRALGAGSVSTGFMTMRCRVPDWRILASIAAVAGVYFGGRIALGPERSRA
jgi:hypothetical protein